MSKSNGRTGQLNMNCLKPYEDDIIVTGRNVSAMSSSEINDESKSITLTNETDKGETLEIKTYYEGSLLQNKEKEAILSNSCAIIDLNENPNISIKELPSLIIYKITTEFRFETRLSLDEQIVRLYCNIGSIYISGTTSIERWISKSKLHDMLFRKNYTCTAWFYLSPCVEEYSADFLLIGRIMK